MPHRVRDTALAPLDNPSLSGAFIAHDLLRRPRQHEKPRLLRGRRCSRAIDRSAPASVHGPAGFDGAFVLLRSVSGLETGDTSMSAEFTPPSGVWLPLITPFKDDAIDAASLRRLVGHFAGKPVDGLIVGATTGEGLTLDDSEIEQLVTLTATAQRDFGLRVPLVLGVCGSDTRKLTKWLARTANWPLDGYLIACPYYTRPSQAGLMLHFAALADSTARPIMIYNIPYRTGVNLGNETMLRLAERGNIVGVKDRWSCCASGRAVLRC
jgi:4-hydroxy-tetrahydrodipicolinate synthase